MPHLSLVACETCELGACDECGLCCQLCECQDGDELPELELGVDLSDMEDERYYWERF